MGRNPHYESQLKIDVEKLKEAPLDIEIRHQCRVFDLVDEQYQFLDPVSGHLTFQYVRGDVYVRGRLEVMTRATCVASLQQFDHLCRADVQLVFVAADKLANRMEDEDDPERHMVHSFSGDVLYPAEALRECLMVELPVFPRAPEGADLLIRRYGVAGDRAAFADMLAPRRPGGSSRTQSDGGNAEEWKNRLRALKDLPDKG
ncbi:MAG: hypothetical protein Kow0059_15110 [Candidatus Sumerlaeia bacterium]